jgi:hypothetical protein
MIHNASHSQQISATEHTPSSKFNSHLVLKIFVFLIIAIDRLVHRGANVVHRLAHKHNHAQPETADDNRPLKKSDSNECLTGNHSF